MEEILRVRASTLDSDAKETVIGEVMVEGLNVVDEVVTFGYFMSSVFTMSGVTDDVLHNDVSGGVLMSPLG